MKRQVGKLRDAESGARSSQGSETGWSAKGQRGQHRGKRHKMKKNQPGWRIVETIIQAIAKLPRGPFWMRDVMVEKRYSFPIALDIGDGREIFIRPEINRMLFTLSVTIMNESFVAHKANFTASEWNSMVKKAFGRVLVDENFEVRPASDCKTILGDVKQRLREAIHDIDEREYIFGCHFCNIPDLKPLLLGPVLFEPRSVWLGRIAGEGAVSGSSAFLVEKRWRDQQTENLKDSEDTAHEIEEEDICDVIGECEFVCSVKVGPAGSEAGLQKALTAARLATTAIALAWDRPSSVLDRMTLTFDREPYRRKNLTLFPSGHLGWSTAWSYLPGGVTWIPREEWEGLIADHDKVFDVAAEVISYVTDNQAIASRPNVLNVLFQAMLWFHEGCREQVDTMAIVKFCASMEALSGGRGTKGFAELFDSRLALRDGKAVQKEIEKIYRDGRSRVVHGDTDKLGHDWGERRDFMETVSRLCLLRCLEWISACSEAKDPKDLLKTKV